MNALIEARQQFGRAAFLIGNGPNLAAGIMPSWKDLLQAAGDQPIDFELEGLSNTEVYDLVELNSDRPDLVKTRVRDELLLVPQDDLAVHRRLMDFARESETPVLTTNFDSAFETSVKAKVHHTDSKGFTRYYPWKTYYGDDQLYNPMNGFGIWKIHGDIRYKDSIRLGLTDYMGSVERSRKLIHRGDDRLFEGKREGTWNGFQTWLHIWFNLPIIIFGFGFGRDEVFLRWLLIERKRYFNIFGRPMEVCYLSTGDYPVSVRNLLENMGVEFIDANGYDEIYGT